MNLNSLCYSIFLFVLLQLCGCSENEHYGKEWRHVTEYLAEVHDISLPMQIDKVIVVGESQCPTCDRAFAKLVFDKYKDNQSAFYVVSARGNRINLEPFLELQERIVFDWNTPLALDSMLDQSLIYYFDDEKRVDTCLRIQFKTLRSQLDYIIERE